MMGIPRRQYFNLAQLWSSVLLLLAASGCGSTKTRLATEQLVMSDAVDQAVSEIDFRPLSGRKVFLDTKYAQNTNATAKLNIGNSFVNSDYIISSVRQQMMAADCRLVDTQDQADLIAELRIGALGTDANDMVYGLPASSAVSGAASLVPNAPVIPPIPEISVAKREAQLGAAKIALFAYDRESRKPVWQSGISKARSTVQDLWVLGAGPFQRGSSVEGTQFAGTKLRLPHLKEDGTFDESLPVAYENKHVFAAPMGSVEPGPVLTAGFVKELPGSQPSSSEKPAAPTAKTEAEEKKGDKAAVTNAAAAPPVVPPVAAPPAPVVAPPPKSPPATGTAEAPQANSAKEGAGRINVSDRPD